MRAREGEDDLWPHKATLSSLSLNGSALVPAWDVPTPTTYVPHVLAEKPLCLASLLSLCSLNPLALCTHLDFIPYLGHLHCPPHCGP